MSLVFQIILTALGAFLSVVLTKFLIQNSRAIKELGERIDVGFKLMREEFGRMDERTAKIAELIVSERDKTREIIKSLKASYAVSHKPGRKGSKVLR